MKKNTNDDKATDGDEDEVEEGKKKPKPKPKPKAAGVSKKRKKVKAEEESESDLNEPPELDEEMPSSKRMKGEEEDLDEEEGTLIFYDADADASPEA